MAFEDTSAYQNLGASRDILLRAKPDILDSRRLVERAIEETESFAEELVDEDGDLTGEYTTFHDVEVGYATSALADLTRSPPRPLYALATLERCLHPAADAKEPRKNPLMILPPQVGAP